MASLAAPCLLLAALWLLLSPGQCLSAAEKRSPAFPAPLPPGPAARILRAAAGGAAPAARWWPRAPRGSLGSGDCSWSFKEGKQMSGLLPLTQQGCLALLAQTAKGTHTEQWFKSCVWVTSLGKTDADDQSAPVQSRNHHGREPVNAKNHILPPVPRSVSANPPGWPAAPPHLHSHFHSQKSIPQFHCGRAAGDWKTKGKFHFKHFLKLCQNYGNLRDLTYILSIICQWFKEQNQTVLSKLNLIKQWFPRGIFLVHRIKFPLDHNTIVKMIKNILQDSNLSRLNKKQVAFNCDVHWVSF